jgi:hypothetical protein
MGDRKDFFHVIADQDALEPTYRIEEAQPQVGPLRRLLRSPRAAG